MTILWKEIEGYEGLYKVSNHGEVWSERSQKLLKKGKGGRGYHNVVLTKNKKRKTFYIHRLVANNFIDNPLEKPCVNHIDENKTNNHRSNLEWCTYEENMNWGTAIERIKETRKYSSKWKEAHERRTTKLSKPIIGVNINDGKIIEFPSINEVGRNGYQQSSIWMCVNGRQSVHKGYKWFYKHDFIQGVG